MANNFRAGDDHTELMVAIANVLIKLWEINSSSD